MEENFDLMKLLNKENEIIKKFKNEKLNENETINSLLFILQMQRERINYLEEENNRLVHEKIQLEDKIKNLEFKIPNEFGTKNNFQKFYPGLKQKEFSFLNYNSVLDIKNFTNFEVSNKNNKELEYYKKKCEILEDDKKYLNKRLSEDNKIMIYTPYQKDDLIKQKNFQNSFIDSNVSNYDYRKKTLTPISKSVTPSKN